MSVKHLLILILTCGTILTNGQSVEAEVMKESRLAIKAGYFGEFVMHPGFATGIEYTLRKNQWLNIHWDSEIGAYFHKWNNNALFVQSIIGSRFTTKYSICADINLGIGYMLSTPNGDFYKVDNAGNISEERRPSTSHLKPSISLMIGWNGNRKKEIPLIIQIGLEAYMQSAFNHSFLPHAAARLGIIYSLERK